MLRYNPYFYLCCDNNLEGEISFFLEKKFTKNISSIEIVEKTDLEQINHLSGTKKKYLKLSFKTVSDLVNVRGQLKPQIDRKKLKNKNQQIVNENDFFRK